MRVADLRHARVINNITLSLLSMELVLSHTIIYRERVMHMATKTYCLLLMDSINESFPVYTT